MTSSNRPLRATCTKTAAPTWFAEAIWTLLLFWPTVARSCQLDSALDERSFRDGRIPKSATFPSKTTIYRCSSILQRLTVTHIIDQFRHKRCQKKHKDLSLLHLKRSSSHIAAALRSTWALLFWPKWPAAVDRSRS